MLTAPPGGAAPFDARPCADFREFAAAQELDWGVTGLDPAVRSSLRERLAGQWEREGRRGRTFVVLEAGEVVAVGRAHYGESAVFLTGGATAPHARGRGAYTSLVHARWTEAVTRGTAALVTQASPDSDPILARLGFESIGRVDLYRDRI